jgi:4-hydroxy-tetrahydrodipicolinate reductase
VITVAVSGAAGRMGREVVRAVSEQRDMKLVAAIDRSRVDEDAGIVAGIGELGLPIRERPGETMDETRPDVLVEFTLPGISAHIAMGAVKRGIRTIIGASGLSATDRSSLRVEAEQQGTAVLVVPNFAIGAVLMIRFAEQASKLFPNAEIIELHHDGKLDSPSGTARSTAERIALSREGRPHSFAKEHVTMEGARGAEISGVKIHSVRLPGLVAHQEVLFGGEGELLTIRHDSADRRSFMPGVLLAIRRIQDMRGLTVGLDSLLP